MLLATAIKCPTLVADKKHGSLEADLHAVRTAQGRDGDTNVHSRVAAICYHVGPQSKAKGGGNVPDSMSTRSRMTLDRTHGEQAESVPGGMHTA